MRPVAEVVAHRGASAHRPEHTHAAFELALAQGADVLELDVRATADGVPVVVHDPTLDRTHGLARPLAELPRRALPGDVLTLEDVLGRYAGRAGLLVELKEDGPVAARATALLHGVPGVVVQSFLAGVLRRAAGQVPVALLLDRRPRTRELDRLAGWAEGVGVPHEAADAALAGAVHHRGLRLRAFTPNAADDLARLAGAGVDALITDAPDRARAVVDAPVAAAA